MNARRPQRFIQFRLPLWAAGAAAYGAAYGLGVLLMIAFDAPILLAVVTLLALWPCERLVERRRIQLDADGITLLGWFGHRRHVPWARLSALCHQGRSATFTADGEVILLDERTPWWHRLFREVERHVQPEPEPADRPAEVPAAEVARCLGIGADEVLTCRPGYNWTCAAVGLVYAIAAAFMPSGALFVLFRILILLACPGMLLEGRHQPQREVRADVSGLARGRGRAGLQVPWSAVRSIDDRVAPFLLDWYHTARPGEPASRQVRVTTDAGEISFLRNDPGGAQLEAGIRKLLAARDAGHALPSGAPLSEAALSQARLSGESDAERGLSRIADAESQG
jgi:hypothetical protein